MTNIERQNIKLLNLCDAGCSVRTILRILRNCNDHLVCEDDIKEELGDTPTCDKMLNAFKEIDTSFYSIYCLARFDINIFVLERIHASFNTMEELSNNLSSLTSLHLQNNTIEKIITSLKELKLNYFIDLKEELLEEIEANEPFLNYSLKEKMLNKYPSLSVEQYELSIESLIEENKIGQSIDGYKIKRITLFDYLQSKNDEDTELVKSRLQGQTLQQLADKRNVTKERMRQILINRVRKYPTFYNEEKYHRTLNLYSLSDDECELIGLNDKLLVAYIRIKYRLNPNRNALDYIADFDLSGTELATSLLKSNNLVLVDGDLIHEDFIQLMKKYVNKYELHSFCLKEIKEKFNEFLVNHFVSNEDVLIGGEEDIVVKTRKMANSPYFLAIGNQRLFVYRPDSLSSDLIELLDNYFNEFYGYGSIGYFYNQNSLLCNKNHICNEKELFVLAKALFGEKCKEKIEFVRNPTLVTKGTDKDLFLENMILDMDLPCTVDDFLEYVSRTTGLQKNSVHAQMSSIIAQHRNSKGLITLDDEVTSEQYDYIKNIIGDSKCIGYSYIFDRVELKYGNQALKILNYNNLRKIGFVKTNTSIYSVCYPNRLEAVLDSIDSLDKYIFTENELMKISNVEYFYYRNYDFINSNSLIKIGENKYLNLRKRNQSSLFGQLKKVFFEIIEPEKVYVLDDFIGSYLYRLLLEKDRQYEDLFLTFEPSTLIKNLVLGLRKINYIETATTYIFSKRDLSIKVLIDDVLNEYGALSLLELKEILYDKYYLQKDVSNTELSDLGYYCPKSSEKVYLTKEYYEKELEDYLNGNS